MSAAPASAAPKKKPKVHKPEDKLLAFKLWLDNGKPSMRQLAKLLEGRGIKVNQSSLHKWAEANSEWARHMLDKEPARPAKIITALKEAEEDATALAPEVFLGVKAQLVARLYESVKQLPLNSIEEWNRGLDCCERLEALIHAERGKAILDKKSSIVSVSLMERLNPTVTIAPFKTTNGSANGGGH